MKKIYLEEYNIACKTRNVFAEFIRTQSMDADELSRVALGVLYQRRFQNPSWIFTKEGEQDLMEMTATLEKERIAEFFGYSVVAMPYLQGVWIVKCFPEKIAIVDEIRY